jgi:hypothetical protein
MGWRAFTCYEMGINSGAAKPLSAEQEELQPQRNHLVAEQSQPLPNDYRSDTPWNETLRTFALVGKSNTSHRGTGAPGPKRVF